MLFKKNHEKINELENKLSIVSKKYNEIEQRIDEIKDVELKELLKKSIKNAINQYKEDLSESNLFLRFNEIENAICRGDNDGK